ncbi:hypothetical protein FGW37_10580 [Streptomyces rectiverticillatus]|uniref:hypothetical protein n=1 Tax=Streptomyces rectiverticillatus TaxID=173860 RepID=UPI0015C31EDE|nr:hypothetical protein [Streptomyces rectiverticillatus]QLE71989.1 hypothetical protein FGW37_10580 [Streptomyces rectiverticillatus]
MSAALRRGALAAFAAASLLTLSACGDADKGGEQPSAAQSSGPATGSAAPAPGKGAGARPLTGEQAKAALLTPGDLPSGWEVNKDIPAYDVGATGMQFGKAGTAACQPLLDAFVGADNGPKAQAHAMTDLKQAGETGIQMTQGITSYQEAEAVKIMQQKIDFGACGKFAAKGADGTTDQAAGSELTVPALGDGARGMRVVFAATEEGVSIQHDIAAVRVGGTVVTVSQASFTTADTAAFEASLRKAVEKVQKVQKAQQKAGAKA